jgi:carotenoid cleavage dioxygenase-like enzyme
MPRVDDRFVTKPYTTLFLAMTNKTVGRDDAVTGGSYNSVAVCNVQDGTYRFWSAGADTAVHEVAFVPRTEDGT